MRRVVAEWPRTFLHHVMYAFNRSAFVRGSRSDVFEYVGFSFTCSDQAFQSDSAVERVKGIEPSLAAERCSRPLDCVE